MSIRGQALPTEGPIPPAVLIGDVPARAVRVSSRGIDVVVPSTVECGLQPIRVEGVVGETPFVEIGTVVASGLHQVDSPALGPDGSLYVTYSGSRAEQAPVSIYRVKLDGVVEPFSLMPNPTSLAFGPDDSLYGSSRFEGVVYRLDSSGAHTVFASDLGSPFGLVFDGDTLYVGDRSGTVNAVDRAGKAASFASLPPSVAAYHLALGPDRDLYVTAPTLASHDCVYRIDAAGVVDTWQGGFGRPQGLAFDGRGRLHVVEALAGSSGIHRLVGGGRRELVVAGRDLIGVAFDSHDHLIAATSHTVYRFDHPRDTADA